MRKWSVTLSKVISQGHAHFYENNVWPWRHGWLRNGCQVYNEVTLHSAKSRWRPPLSSWCRRLATVGRSRATSDVTVHCGQATWGLLFYPVSPGRPPRIYQGYAAITWQERMDRRERITAHKPIRYPGGVLGGGLDVRSILPVCC